MPYKEYKIERKYWTMGAVAEALGITHSTIHFWERKGLIHPIKRKEKRTRGLRLFTVKQLTHLMLIKSLRDYGIEIKLIKLALRGNYAEGLRAYLQSKNE